MNWKNYNNKERKKNELNTKKKLLNKNSFNIEEFREKGRKKIFN